MSNTNNYVTSLNFPYILHQFFLFKYILWANGVSLCHYIPNNSNFYSILLSVIIAQSIGFLLTLALLTFRYIPLTFESIFVFWKKVFQHYHQYSHICQNTIYRFLKYLVFCKITTNIIRLIGKNGIGQNLCSYLNRVLKKSN